MSDYQPSRAGRSITKSLFLCMLAFGCVGYGWAMYAGVAYAPPVADNGFKVIAVIFAMIWLISAALILRFQRKS